MVKSDPDVPQASFIWKYTPLTRIVTVHSQKLFKSEGGYLPIDFCELVYNLDSLLILALSHDIRKKANPLLDALAAFQSGERGKAAKR